MNTQEHIQVSPEIRNLNHAIAILDEFSLGAYQFETDLETLARACDFHGLPTSGEIIRGYAKRKESK